MSQEKKNPLSGTPNEDVKRLQDNLRRLGFRIKDEKGVLGETTKRAITTFQKRTKIAPTGIPDSETLNAIRTGVSALAFTVKGAVTSPFRAGVGGLRIEIVDRNVGGDVHLAEASTSDDGTYTVAFEFGVSKQRAKRRPDLQARAFANGTLLGASDVKYNASNRETLNILLTEEASSTLPSEHETLTKSLLAIFHGNLRDLKEEGDREDITYLANKTGWDARAVAMAALADQFSASTTDAKTNAKIEPAFFYALFRSGLPANQDTLYQTDIKTINTIWTRGIKQGIIPSALEKNIPVTLQNFQKLSVQHTIDGPALAGISTLKEMLSRVLGDNATAHEQFAKVYTQYRKDPPTFWNAVRNAFGETTEKRLRIDGKLGYLTLNNAPLILKMHEKTHTEGQTDLTDTISLVASGYYRADKWQDLIADVPIPEEIPGNNVEEKRVHYAELLAAQIRLSYPTAVIAQMVKTGETKIADELADSVYEFLNDNQKEFQIGVQPIEQYLLRKKMKAPSEVVNQIKRIQRMYQISSSDAAMNSLLKKGFDSAYAVTRYSRDEFIRTFKDELGGEAQASLTYAKSLRVRNVVLNIATHYLTAKMAPQIGLHSSEGFMDPTPAGPDPQAANASDVIAYPTLESLWGEMDYCECEQCRSILSPAAYLVDLLDFCDRPVNEKRNPLDVLLERRPDLQYIPLTCENTNIPIPYIDLVNETLEYFITNSLTLANYKGHSVDDSIIPAELLASPQFVAETAYEILSGKPAKAGDPSPILPPTSLLPFHQPLENMRRFFDVFEVQLQDVMETLRKNDNVERASVAEYGWRDILMEELRLSRAEYALLTDRTLTLQSLYGFSPTTANADVLTELSRVKPFSRRVAVSYEGIIEIIKTRFVNPNAFLIPKLQQLGITFSAIKRLKDDQNAGNDTSWFDAMIVGVDATPYGGDIKGWLANNYANIMGLITVVNTSDEEDMCSFDALEFRYANPDNNANKLRAFEFVRLIRFIRLWRKLGWTIEETDKTIMALYPSNQLPNDPNDAVNLQRLDAGFLSMLPRLGVTKSLMDDLKLKPAKDLLTLLACFAPIDTQGPASLYRQMFPSSPPSKQNEAFIDKGNGQFLTDAAKKLLDYSEVLRGAFLLTDDELSLIIASLGFDKTTSLNIDNVSAIFRRGWLARKLKLSVREFLLLVQFTGLDPFSAPDPPNPPIVTLIEFLNRLRATSIKPVQALYLMWNQDFSGKSIPTDKEITGFARTLRADLASIETRFAVADDPTGQIARARMAMVYSNEATDMFFGLIDNTFVTSVPYVHKQDKLEQAIVDAAQGRISYDSFHRQLLFTSVMTVAIRDALKTAPNVTPDFTSAVDKLYTENQKIVGSFFASFPELQTLYDAYVASNDPPEKKRSDLLASFLPEFKRRRKRQQALEAVSALRKTEVELAIALLDNPEILHAARNNANPLLDDLVALEKPGLSAKFFFKDTATDPPNLETDLEAMLTYSADSNNKLPANPTPGKAISAIWSGYLEVPENASYNFSVETDPGATVELKIGSETPPLSLNGNAWTTDSPINLLAGKLNSISVKVEKVKDTLSISWETKGSGWKVISESCLYSETLVDNLRAACIRFLKAASLKAGLKLTTNELTHFAAHDDYKIGGFGWMNSLPTTGSPDNNTSASLLKVFSTLLDFANVKTHIDPNSERLLAVLEDPKTVTQNEDSLLNLLTCWEPDSLDALLARFGLVIDDLAHFEDFYRIYDSYLLVKKLGIPASALLNADTNEPNSNTVREFEAALRARYAESDWLNVLKPINDEMRELQRDALVSYVLHQMSLTPETEHIDTSDKLFEYFLMDVQMEPCMLTSRIRHALSSVQLFIERCLMNLEPDIAPTSINAKFWEWMKRYRVWEANRRVFLYPESWLEPELRDDMSPFFKEMMSELLQSDITEDKAAIALSNYLSKLQEVAKLEPCGIYCLEGDPGTADDVDHVVARTSGANRKYFYRKHTASWMPWEQIKLDIEDNPVLPVVWKDRLFLFWLRLIKQTSVNPQDMNTTSSVGDITSANLGDVKTDAQSTAMRSTQMTVQVVLCWSEFYNGKWQPTKTSDVDRPSKLGTYDAAGDFDRSYIRLYSQEFGDEELRITIRDAQRYFFTFFDLYNAHSLPERLEDAIPMSLVYSDIPLNADHYRTITMLGNTLKLSYGHAEGGIPLINPLDRSVLNTRDSTKCRVIEPLQNLDNPWDAPFFLENKRHVFYVTTTQQGILLPDWNWFGLTLQLATAKDTIPSIVMKHPPQQFMPPKVPPGPVGDGALEAVNPVPVERFVSEDAYINKGIGTTQSVQYGGVEIGSRGRIGSSKYVGR